MDVDGAPARNPAAGDRVLVALNKAEAFGIPLGEDAFWPDGTMMYYVDGTSGTEGVSTIGSNLAGCQRAIELQHGVHADRIGAGREDRAVRIRTQRSAGMPGSAPKSRVIASAIVILAFVGLVLLLLGPLSVRSPGQWGRQPFWAPERAYVKNQVALGV